MTRLHCLLVLVAVISSVATAQLKYSLIIGSDLGITRGSSRVTPAAGLYLTLENQSASMLDVRMSSRNPSDPPVSARIVLSANEMRLLTFDAGGQSDVFPGKAFRLPCVVEIQNSSDGTSLMEPVEIDGGPIESEGGGEIKYVRASGFPALDAIRWNAGKGNPQAQQLHILSMYLSNPSHGVIDSALIRKEFGSNPFLRDEIERLFPEDGSGSLALKRADPNQPKPKGTGSTLGNSLLNLPSFDVTNIADGVAKFLVKRAKQELSIAFFDKFKSTLEDSSFRDLRSVFPRTFTMLNGIDGGIYQYDAYLQGLRESFEQDFQSAATNIPAIIDNHPAYFKAHPELAALLQSGCYFAQQLKNQEHPGIIIRDFPGYYLDGVDANLSGGMRTVQLISESFRSRQGSSYWLSIDSIGMVLQNPATLKIYLGLLYQKALNDHDHPIKFENTTLLEILGQIGHDFPVEYPKCRRYFVKVAEEADRLQRLIKAQRDLPLIDSLGTLRYFDYINASVALISTVEDLDILDIHHEVGEKISAASEFLQGARRTLTPYVEAFRSITLGIGNVQRKNYASALVNFGQFYNVVRPRLNLGDKRREMELKSTLNDLTRNAQSERAEMQMLRHILDPSKVIVYLKERRDLVEKLGLLPVDNASVAQYMKELENVQKLMNALGADTMALKEKVEKLDQLVADHQKELADIESISDILVSAEVQRCLIRYGTFMATLIQAKNSDEVENAIEAFALPPGSFRTKRFNTVNFALNGYIGGYYGAEKIFSGGPGNSTASLGAQLTAGLTAPIGLSLSWGNILQSKSSLSAFLSIVDLGAIAAYRIGEDSAQHIPTVQLKDIVSPGLFLSYGFPGSIPLSLTGGWQMGPNLHAVTGTENEYSDGTYGRWSVSLVVDIPILDFYTKE